MNPDLPFKHRRMLFSQLSRVLSMGIDRGARRQAAVAAVSWGRRGDKFQPPQGRRRSLAFTLIELLVVMAIICILVALLSPVLSKVRNNADSSTCLSNLRQVGMAIGLYSQDHAGYLPGPLYSAQFAWYGDNGGSPVSSSQSLMSFLAPYLGLPPPPATWTDYASIFMCPSFAKKEGGNTGPAYCIQQDVTLNGKLANGKVTGNVLNPWGYGTPGTGGGSIPFKMTQLSEALTGTYSTATSQYVQGDLSQTWAIADNDKLDGNPAASWYNQIPSTPVHGAYRNALFFDWHAQQLPISAIQQQ